MSHFLNYASDESSDSESQDIKQVQEDLIETEQQMIKQNDTWGRQKANFYGRDKEADHLSSSEEDQDELEEAQRLQSIRARKLAQMEDMSDDEMSVVESDQEGKPVESSESDEDVAGLGDKLFGAKKIQIDTEETLGLLNDLKQTQMQLEN